MKPLRRTVGSILADDRRYLPLLFLVVSIPSVILYVRMFTDGPGHDPGEFYSYYAAAVHLCEGGDPYETGFLYPPLTLAPLLPLTLLARPTAGALALLANAGALVLSILVITTILGHYGMDLSRREQGLLLLAAFLYYPTRRNFLEGNVNILLLLLMSLFYLYFFVRERYVLSGVLLAVCVFIKLWPAALLPLAVFSRRRSLFLAAFALAVCLLVTVSLITFGVSHHVRFAETFLAFQNIAVWCSVPEDLSTVGNITDDNWSFTASVTKLVRWRGLTSSQAGRINAWLLPVKALLIALFVFLVFKVRRGRMIRPEREILSFSLSLSWIFLVGNVAWMSYFTYFMLPMLLVLALPPRPWERLLILGIVGITSWRIFLIHAAQLWCSKLATLLFITPPCSYAFLLWLILLGLTVRRGRGDVSNGGEVGIMPTTAAATFPR